MTAPRVVERYLDAIISHDWDALAACLSDDGFARVGPWGDEYDDKAELQLLKLMKPIINGIMVCIILACAGSMPVMGVMRCITNMVITMEMGRMYKGSGEERSFTQRKLALRSSTACRSIVKRPKKIGIWIIIGRQPLTGLTP